MKPADAHSKVAPLSRSTDAIESEAADWLALREYRPLTAVEQAGFEAWLAADPRHATAVAELKSAWSALDGLAEYPRPADGRVNPDFFARPRRFRRVPWLALGAAAAVACALLIKVAPWSPAPATPDSAAIVAQQDAARILRLSDGSLVELRAGSEVEEKFAATERRVRLVRGEAYFSVAKNPARPFIVDANGVAVRAVGTAFNVRLDSDSVVVLVTEGKVKVQSPAGASALPRAEPVPEAQLGAGQRTVLPMAAKGIPVVPVVENVSAVEIERALAWQGSNLVFDATPLSQVVAQFNRRNTSQLVIVRDELSDLRISGRFRADSVEGFAELMESSFGVAVSRRGNDILLGQHP